MLKAGMFPDGHLDDKETCFMLNNVIYRQYLETEKAYLEQKKISEQEKEQNTAGTDTQDTDQSRREQELHSMVAEGMEYIRHLRDLNDRIEGEAISEKLYRLENLLKEIFDRVQEHPEQMHRMHKLMDYYLPTMLKLVEQYAEFDEISSPGEDILDAKKEIEKTLDMINQAFVTLLNNLFRDAAFDASADAQVLQTMLAREGLTESDFVREKVYDSRKAMLMVNKNHERVWKGGVISMNMDLDAATKEAPTLTLDPFAEAKAEIVEKKPEELVEEQAVPEMELTPEEQKW